MTSSSRYHDRNDRPTGRYVFVRRRQRLYDLAAGPLVVLVRIYVEMHAPCVHLARCGSFWAHPVSMMVSRIGAGFEVSLAKRTHH